MTETKEILGENSYTQWVNKRLEVLWIPMMNPVYLTENNLWDDFSDLEKKIHQLNIFD